MSCISVFFFVGTLSPLSGRGLPSLFVIAALVFEPFPSEKIPPEKAQHGQVVNPSQSYKEIGKKIVWTEDIR
jgi:hypothetical protein